jgi:hypothetical protein
MVMESDLAKLYERFDSYWARLEADVRKATRRLPAGMKAAFHVPRPTFAEFQTIWKGIQSDPTLIENWMRRMTPTGYDDEARAVEAELLRLRQARDADSREAA